MSNIKTNVSRQYSRGSLFQPQPVEQPIQQQSSDNVSFTINDVYEHDGNVPTQNNPQLHPLDSLTADNYKSPVEPEQKPKPRGRPPKAPAAVSSGSAQDIIAQQIQMLSAQREKPTPAAKSHAPVASHAHTDSSEPMSENDVLGREVRALYTRIQRYKNSFPQNEAIQSVCKKIKKNASQKDLELVLLEFENILDMSANIDTFIVHSILQILPLAEQFTEDTDYDITGLAAALKKNKDFMSQCTELFLKYSSIYSCPCEIRLTYSLLVTTASVISQNQAKKQVKGKTVDSTILNDL